MSSALKTFLLFLVFEQTFARKVNVEINIDDIADLDESVVHAVTQHEDVSGKSKAFAYSTDTSRSYRAWRNRAAGASELGSSMVTEGGDVNEPCK